MNQYFVTNTCTVTKFENCFWLNLENILSSNFLVFCIAHQCCVHLYVCNLGENCTCIGNIPKAFAISRIVSAITFNNFSDFNICHACMQLWQSLYAGPPHFAVLFTNCSCQKCLSPSTNCLIRYNSVRICIIEWQSFE